MIDQKKYPLIILAAALVITASIVLLIKVAESNTVNTLQENSSAAKSSHEAASSDAVSPVTARLEPVKRIVSRINVMIDPRIELLASVQLISSYDQKFGLITRLDFKYKNDMKRYFAAFSKHEAVKMFDRMSGKNFSFDAPPAAMLYLSNPPELDRVRDFSEYITGRAGGRDLDKFIADLRNFARDSNFSGFYRKNKDFYDAVIEKNTEIIKDNDYIDELEAYYGMKQNSYNIILSPLFHNGGFGPRLENADGSYDIFSIQGPTSVEGNIPVFGDKEGLAGLVKHEFGHSFVNPLTEKYQKEVNKYKGLYTPLASKMQKQGYSEWLSCVNEHVDRAVSCRLVYLHDGKKAYDNAVAYERSRSFLYIDALVEKLVDFENNREKYKSFEDFYPEIVNVFKELSGKKLGANFYDMPFTGPINAIFSEETPICMIVPTNEKDERIQKLIKKAADKVSSMIKKNYKIEVITDEQALNKDLGSKNIIVYGTMEGNLWLDKYSGSFPFKISSDSIIADKTYKGSGMRFITALPSPVNKDNGIVIYTAQRAADIPDINTVFHGPTDFIIAEGIKEIKSGNYIKDSNVWSFRQPEDE